MSFSNPNALLLLLLIPIFIAVGYPRSPYKRARSIASVVIRVVLVLLIVLALAGFQIPQNSDRLGVVFLVDVSDSMSPRTQNDALDYVRAAIEELDSDNDQAAVILFGSDAIIEQPMTATLDLSQLGANPITLNTDLAEAMRLGLALFPADAAKRMVILSDGVQTVGDAESAARLAQATNVQIDYVPFTSEIIPEEVLVTDVSIPPRVNEEELFDVVVTVDSETDTNAVLRVLAAGSTIYEDTVALSAGSNRFVIPPLQLPETGFVDFRVQVEPQGADGFFQNNELSAFTQVRGRPTVLLVTQSDEDIQFLRPALEENGILVETVTPRDLPTGLAGLGQYSSIVLVNTPATELTVDRMELLQVYVRDFGGGLVAIGGPDSYGVGGYFETPLEETLPVDMRIRDQERVPTMTMLFVLDRSGSMAMAGPSGFTNLELAKEAIIRSFNFLNDYDRTGVISFDTGASFIIDVQEIGDANNREALEGEVGELRPGGGTDIFGALQAAGQYLPDDPSAIKHMILITDGGASPLQSEQLADALYQNFGITLSVVAVGQGYAPWIRNLANAGRGNFHEAFDVSTIPSIFTAETVLATRSYIFEEEFLPTLTGRSPIMDGISGVPTLQGYIATTEKDTATVIMRTPEEDPLLATWQYGLGRSVAFTSDAAARWGVNWVTWAEYARFWSQAIRWTITEGSDSNLEVRVEQRGEQAFLVVDARDDDGEFLNGLNLSTSVINPDLESDVTVIPQVAPGRYEVAFTPENEGAYFMRVAGTGNNSGISVNQSAGWVLSYSAEYRLNDTDIRFLDRLSDITNGQSLAGNPAGAFEHNLEVAQAPQSIWQWLLIVAAFLLILDIAVRRVVVNRSDLEAGREWLTQRLGIGQRQRRQVATSGRMSTLFDAKQRTTADYDRAKVEAESAKRQGRSPAPPPTPVQTPPSPTAARPATEKPSPKPAPRKRPTRETRQKRSPASGSLASRLLETRRDDEDES